MYVSTAPIQFPNNPLLSPPSRNAFIVANMPLVYSISNRYRAACEAARIPLEDAIGEGTIGLILAYDRYNNAEYDFASFAVPYIRGYMQNVFRKSTGPIRIPKRVYALIQRINYAGLNDAPAAVVAEELGISVKQAEHALYCDRIRTFNALPERDNNGRPDDVSALYSDAFITRLTRKQQRLVRLLMAGLTQTEAAQELGMSRQAVHINVRRLRANYEAYEKISA